MNVPKKPKPIRGRTVKQWAAFYQVTEDRISKWDKRGWEFWSPARFGKAILERRVILYNPVRARVLKRIELHLLRVAAAK